MRTDTQFRLVKNLRRRLTDILRFKFKSGSAINDLGCSVEDLKWWLEFWFEEGMSWDNYGKGSDKWNIDHIYPLSKIDLTDRKELLKACHYTNLQPLWFEDNLKKAAKISE